MNPWRATARAGGTGTGCRAPGKCNGACEATRGGRARRTVYPLAAPRGRTARPVLGYTGCVMWLKSLHVTCVALSLSGFGLRGFWMLRGSPLLRRRIVRTLPHVVDTALLASGVALVVRLGFNPLHQHWLLAKILALPLYVVFGALALREGRSRRLRALFLVLALLVAAYIVAAAVTHDPLPLRGHV